MNFIQTFHIDSDNDHFLYPFGWVAHGSFVGLYHGVPVIYVPDVQSSVGVGFGIFGLRERSH